MASWQHESGPLPLSDILGGFLKRAGGSFRPTDSLGLCAANITENLNLSTQVLDAARQHEPPLVVGYLCRNGAALAGRRDRHGREAGEGDGCCAMESASLPSASDLSRDA